MGYSVIRWWDGPVLGIESSCDETSVAVTLESRVLANVVTSQAELHRQWGGVVPEVASRAHVEALLPALERALSDARLRLEDISAIAVTSRPGLVGALSVGVTAAKALHFQLGAPLIGVHHLEGHVFSVQANRDEPIPFPHACLIVSGGHTELLRVDAPGQVQVLSETLDDAAGEAFDKGARLLGLGYPGGFRIQEAAREGDPGRYRLPIGVADDPFHFSFSGLKTAVLRLVEKEGDGLRIADAAASLQGAIVRALSLKVSQAMERTGLERLTVVGGVAANLALREALADICRRDGVQLFVPEISLCTDNAAMIALAGSWRLAAGERSDFMLEAKPSAPIVDTLS